MGNPACVIRIRDILAPGDLCASRHVPQPELGLQPPIGGTAGAAGHYELRVDHAPGVHLRSLVRIADRFHKGLGIDGRKKHGMFEIIGNDAGQLSNGRRIASKCRHRDRYGFKFSSAVHVEITVRLGKGRRREFQAAKQDRNREDCSGDFNYGLEITPRAGMQHREAKFHSISSGSKRTIRPFHWS